MANQTKWESVLEAYGLQYGMATNLSADEVNDTLLDTFQAWVSFALGISSIGGKILKNPSGRYASAITAKRDPEGRIVAIYVQPGTQGEKEAQLIEYGHVAVDLKSIMLARRAKRSKLTGDLYRHINFRAIAVSPTESIGSYKGGLYGSSKAPLRINKSLARMWATDYDTWGDKFATMSTKPGSAKWEIPAMPPYSVVRILRDSLPPELRDRITLP